MASLWGEPHAPLARGWITRRGAAQGLGGKQMFVIILLKIFSCLKTIEIVW